jgi:hypothetical protein
MNLVVDKNNNKNKNTDKNWWKYRKHPNKAKKWRNPLNDYRTNIEEMLLSESAEESVKKKIESQSEEFEKTAKLVMFILAKRYQMPNEEEAKKLAEELSE